MPGGGGERGPSRPPGPAEDERDQRPVPQHPPERDPPASPSPTQPASRAQRGVVGCSADVHSRDSGSPFDPGGARAAGASGFPSGYSFRHNDVAALLREMLAVPPSQRGPTAAVQTWNDVEFVEMLEGFDDTHGFVLEHDGLNDTTHDDRALPRLSPSQWVWAHAAFKKQLDKGWSVRFASGADIPWSVYRTNRWRLTEKNHLGRQERDSAGALKWRLVDNCSDGMWSLSCHPNRQFTLCRIKGRDTSTSFN